jgi:hypothetical protein
MKHTIYKIQDGVHFDMPSPHYYRYWGAFQLWKEGTTTKSRRHTIMSLGKSYWEDQQ